MAVLTEQSIQPVSYQLDNGMCFEGLSFTTGMINSVETEQLDTGKNNTPRIVLCLHGWLDNAASFSLFFNELIKSQETNNSHSPSTYSHLKNTQFIAIDLIGHGKSSHRSADAQYHFYDWVYDLLLLIEHNQWDKVDLIGHSMGGMIASTFAAAFPEKANSLTLIDSLGYFTLEAENTTKQLRKGLMSRLKQVKRASNGLAKSSKTINKIRAHQSVESAVSARVAVSDLQPEHAKLIIERGTIETASGYRWRSDRRLNNVSLYRLTEEQAKQLMKDLQTPILILYGSKGHEMVPNGLANFSELHPQLYCHELVGGHHIHMEQVTESTELIKKFLTTIV